MNPPARKRAYVAAAALVGAATLLGWVVFGQAFASDVVMLYLLGVVLASLRLGYGPSLFTAVLSVLAFDLFFVPPYLTLAVADPRHLVTFAVMLLVAVVIGELTRRVRDQAEEAQRVRLDSERERLRNALLSAVSHDLRTPLCAVEGAATTLLDRGDALERSVRRDLLQTIREEAERLNRRVGKLLDMTRLDAGATRVNKEWQPLEEVVGSALSLMEDRLSGRDVRTQLPDSLPLVPLDTLLVEQVLVNLLENALKYSPNGPIEVRAAASGLEVVVEVADRGPGIPAGDEERVFERFYRASSGGAPGGVGLGLAICRALVRAHGGRIWAENRRGGGAAFKFTVPLDGAPPRTLSEDPATRGSA